MPEMTLQQAYELAVRHHRAGRPGDAEAMLRQVLAFQPAHVESLEMLARLSHQSGNYVQAIELLQRAIALNPSANNYGNLGMILATQGRLDEAIAALRQSLALQPNAPDTHNTLGNVYKERQLFPEAVAAFLNALSLRPGFAEAHNNLGVALRGVGQLEDAIAEFRKAISLRPDNAQTHSNLGTALKDNDQLDEAIAAYRRAVDLRGRAEDYNDFGVVLHQVGRIDEAIAAYRSALALRPEYADAHFHLAWALLLQGDFQQGWSEYEWRWKKTEMEPVERQFARPTWDGQALRGRRVLLYSEQGYGDTIQFARYIPIVVRHGGRVALTSQPALRRLLGQLPDVEQIAVGGEPMPEHDVRCALMSLPRVLGTTLHTIPADVPYLQVDPALVDRWATRLESDAGRLRVGLVWAGSPNNVHDRSRSIRLSTLADLGRVPHIRWYSLQKGPAADEIREPPPGLELIDLGADLEDFADTAAVIANLDLVISVDTAAVHLAGALGRPAWVLLRHSPDWRWLMNRSDSPWYPTVRLFRQPRLGDWDSAIRQVTQALRALAER